MSVKFFSAGDGRVNLGSAIALLSSYTVFTVFKVDTSSPGAAPRIWSHGQAQKEVRMQGNNTRLVFYQERPVQDTNFQSPTTAGLTLGTWYVNVAAYSSTDDALTNMYVAEWENSADPLSAKPYIPANVGSGQPASTTGLNFWVGNRPNGGTNRAGEVSFAGIMAISTALNLSAAEVARFAWDHPKLYFRHEIIDASSTAEDTGPNGWHGIVEGSASTDPDQPAFPTATVQTAPIAAFIRANV